MLLFMCRIEEAAPMLTDGSTHIKFINSTPQTPIGNKNGFVSTDELHQRNKHKFQRLKPQVNAPTSKGLPKPRSVPKRPLHFLLIFSTNRFRHWEAGCCSSAPKKPSTLWHPKSLHYSKHSAMVTYPGPNKSNPPFPNYCFNLLAPELFFFNFSTLCI